MIKKTKVEQRIENSLNAFFGNESIFEENKLSHSDNTSLLKNQPEDVFTKKADAFTKILKTIFLFLPGAFFLYFSSIFFLYAFFVGKTSLFDLGFGLILWTASVLITVFSIGKIIETKYLLIPASICAVSFIFFISSLFLPEAMQVKFLFEYSAYLFPIVLIAPFLVKSSIDKTENE